MPKLFSTRRGVIIAAVVALLLVAIGICLAIWARPCLLPYVIAVLFFVVGWLLLELWLRARGRRSQADFDAKLAAREGIADRRREWDGWTTELRKQGIDRYELPFYLLVGEPQSGKSVLLQNSDLHFPFGQNRLSGIGGTKGCDWWFTEEAVVLDLAGRLFTHEGGASDEAEWQAFLELLADFRPMCPANGVLLVLPCDGLLNDTPQQAATKAARMQTTLLTLTQRLQVQLPVYVVLTKGDQVFGFAETMHRLETEKRHEMFGWSRPAERVEAPFELDEMRAGFAALLQRCRLLRSQMLSTARVPEALGEVDRLYAFPDEFATILPNFEIYLRSIFTESALLDRLFFRGFYLTSGLQTGTPIAKVCASLLGGDREADQRKLEGLFAKQRAYFIRDLVRKRVFGERGIVRPTPSRLVKARRAAWLGYGFAGAITAATVTGIALYLPGTPEDIAFYDHAKSDVVSWLDPAKPDASPPLPELLAQLQHVRDAAQKQRPLLERLLPFGIGTSAPAFERGFVALFDRCMPRALRMAAEAQLEAKSSDPAATAIDPGLPPLTGPASAWREKNAAKLQTLAKIRPGARRLATAASAAAGSGAFALLDAAALRLDFDKRPLAADAAPPDLRPLIDLGVELERSDPAQNAEAIAGLGHLLELYLGGAGSFAPVTDAQPDLDAAMVTALKLACDRELVGAAASRGEILRRNYLRATCDATLRWWSSDAATAEAAVASHVVRLFASLRLAASESFPPELTAGPNYKEWLARLDAVVGARLGIQRDRLLRNWDVADADLFAKFATLKEVAQHVKEVLGDAALADRRHAVDVSKMQDARAELLDPKRLEPRLVATLAAVKLLLAALDPPAQADLAASRSVAGLRDFAGEIERLDANDLDARHEFTRKWVDDPSDWRTRPDDPTSDVARCYVASVAAALDVRLLREQREWFTQEFKKGFLDANDRPAWDGLLLARSSLSESSRENAWKTLENWLDRGRRLDQVADHFRLRGTVRRTLHPTPKELSNELTNDPQLTWELFDFLDRLQKFLLPAEKTALKDATVRYTLTLGLDEPGTIWWPSDPAGGGRGAIQWFGVVQRAGAVPDQEFFVNPRLREAGAKISSDFTWASMPPATPALLALGWNRTPEMPTRTSDDAERPAFIESFPGPLGLLNFAWKGRPKQADVLTDWVIEFALKSGTTTIRAPFKLHFAQPLPEIPETIRRYAWPP